MKKRKAPVAQAEPTPRRLRGLLAIDELPHLTKLPAVIQVGTGVDAAGRHFRVYLSTLERATYVVIDNLYIRRVALASLITSITAARTIEGDEP